METPWRPRAFPGSPSPVDGPGTALPYAGRVTAPVQGPDAPVDAETPASGAPTTSRSDSTAPAWRTPLIAGVAAAGGCVAIALVNPTDSGVPICWSQALFGVDCPLCGGLRATNALVRGDVLAAADHNVFVAFALPVVAVVWVAWVVAHLAGRPFRLPKLPRSGLLTLASLALAFTVARNVGGPAWVDWLHSSTYR